MAKYICRKKCQFRQKIWEVGETLDSVEGENVPKHFSLASKNKPPTLIELREKQRYAQAVVDAIKTEVEVATKVEAEAAAKAEAEAAVDAEAERVATAEAEAEAQEKAEAEAAAKTVAGVPAGVPAGVAAVVPAGGSPEDFLG